MMPPWTVRVIAVKGSKSDKRLRNLPVQTVHADTVDGARDAAKRKLALNGRKIISLNVCANADKTLIAYVRD
jgi:hypothetical protein